MFTSGPVTRRLRAARMANPDKEEGKVKKVLVIAGVIVTGVVAAGAALLGYAGFFRPVEVTEGIAGPYTLVYVKLKGEFSQAGTAIEETTRWLEENGVKPGKGFGLYMDNPRTTPKGEWRFIAGCILEEGYRGKIPMIRKKYRVEEFAAVRAVLSEFPFRNKLNMFAGLVKVYPALGKYGEERGYPPKCIMEIYDTEGEKIVYVQPVEKSFDGPAIYYR